MPITQGNNPRRTPTGSNAPNMKRLFRSVTLLLLAQFVAPAGELGRAAAPLKISEWVKGKPVDLAAAKGKQVVVVEFWATWCPPCRDSIPHLTELQKKFPDVVFVGVTDEEADPVKKFITKLGDQMDYVVAIDAQGQTSKGYLGEFGISGIPHAFVVDKEGRVAWHGHPLAGLEKVLTEVRAGKFDVAKANQRAKAQKKLGEFYQAVSTGAAEEKLVALGQELEALDAEIGGFYPDRKFSAAEARKMVKFELLRQEYQQALESNTERAGLAELEKQLEANAPKNFRLADIKESIALRKVFANYYNAATGRRDANKLPQYTQELLALDIKNAEALNQVAWQILTDKNIKQRDLELATKLAKAGVAASEGKMAAVLDTYARALFDSGQVAAAIEQQQKAIHVADDEAIKAELTRTLKRYQTQSTGKAPPKN